MATSSTIDAPPQTGILDVRLIAMFATVGCVGFGTNLSIQAINLGMHARGVDTSAIGLSTAMQAVGIVLAAPLAPTLMRRIGIRPAMAVGAALSAAMMLMFTMLTGFVVVTLARVAYAIGLALVFTCAEFVILASVRRESRGWCAGLYSSVLGLGMIAGPLVVSYLGVDKVTACYVGLVASLGCLPAAVVGLPTLCPPVLAAHGHARRGGK